MQSRLKVVSLCIDVGGLVVVTRGVVVVTTDSAKIFLAIQSGNKTNRTSQPSLLNPNQQYL